MSKHLFKYLITVCFVSLLFLINSCSDKTDPQTKSAAVSKKIVAKKSETAPSDVPATLNIPVKQGAEVKEVKTDAITAKIISGPEKPPNPVQPPILQDKEKPGETLKTGIMPTEAKATTSSTVYQQPSAPGPAAEISKIQSETIPVYNPQGRIDPFIPLFKDEGPSAGTEKERKGRIPRTPLEMIDLGQLKLVAIMRAPSGNKALVEEASGKGYIVTKGTYLGINSGRVIKVLKDRVVVEEEVESIVGKSTIQERELKLQKPLGEE